MPKSDTWPGGVAMESLSNMESAGSCDSSEDSMEHLSAEERACLMYLEETIEALEVQEDSGFSNDEPEPGHLAEKMDQRRGEDISSVKSDESKTDQESFLSYAVPTPIAHLPAVPGSRALTVDDKAEPHAPEPQSTADSSSLKLMTQPKPSVPNLVADCKVSSPATQTEVLSSSTDGPGNSKHVPTAQSTKASDIHLDLIPPPSDFMDEPDLPPQPEKEEHLPLFAETSDNRPTSIDLEQQQQRALTKKTSVDTPVTEEPPNKPSAGVPASLNPQAVATGPLMSPPPEAAEPRSPPAVAPKPKKLPANIILKSHKASVAGSDTNSVHSVPASTDRQMLDPQRVRIEALRKLGLLKSEEADSGPILSPKLSPKSRKSWAAPPRSPISPAAPHTPPSTPSYSQVNSTPPVAVAPSATFAAPDILPVPAAFSDGHLPSNTLQDVLGATVNMTPPHTPPALLKLPTPPKKTGIKSATLERSGLGLSSYMAQESKKANQDISGEQSLNQLRNNRPRPASLGSRKEFSSSQGEVVQAGIPTSKNPNSRVSLPLHTAFQHSGDSQKLPRSQGISVLICPRAENGENRREALKKLGLLRD
ncbi:specifically androgen-regulated gene protein isoform X2 [Scomber japonicus]|uniref:specifically androgen-regulated gene protein isoform X2 n=1 Tax=Scomber japonicus TaxID=13676 RepID=UPI0023062BEE|nr:specifically androgen-regulated gene protein isoform X2 [Scomber japonicus]